ncbi:MAG: NADH-quinone oxidoreductase subunit H [Sulfurimonas sp.]|jgi:NADH-quinone oxidoreductase subunit H
MDMYEIIFSFLVFPGGLFVLALGLFLLGIDRKVYARLQRRVGPPLYQPFVDVIKLLKKEMVIADTSHVGAFLLSELFGFSGMMVAIILIPISGVFDGYGGFGDLVVILYLLSFPALSLMLAGSSSSSPFGAVGFSREMVMMMAYEIPFLIVLVTVAFKVGMFIGDTPTFSLSEIVNFQIEHGSFLFDYTMIPAFIAFMIFIPGIIGVVPFDLAEAETEILEGPILEYSGSGLALFNLMSAIKLVVVLGLGIALFFPAPMGDNFLLNLLGFFLKCLILMIFSITIVRASTGRMRIDQAFKYYLTIPTVLALISLGLTLFEI